jgi:DNA-binding NarL/FixJ family response regulator
MRVVLVGPAAARARLRAQANGSLAIVDEAPSVSAAREHAAAADAFLIAVDAGQAVEQLVEPLTPRETDVLQLLAQGLSNKGIALRLGISDQTVKVHVAAISGKLGAANRTEAVRLAIRLGLVAL